MYAGSTVVHGYWNSTGIHGNRREQGHRIHWYRISAGVREYFGVTGVTQGYRRAREVQE